MKFIKLPNRKAFDLFLIWYIEEVNNYQWYPVTVAGRVNILNKDNEMIAYKCLDVVDGEYVISCYVREKEYNMFLNKEV